MRYNTRQARATAPPDAPVNLIAAEDESVQRRAMSKRVEDDTDDMAGLDASHQHGASGSGDNYDGSEGDYILLVARNSGPRRTHTTHANRKHTYATEDANYQSLAKDLQNWPQGAERAAILAHLESHASKQSWRDWLVSNPEGEVHPVDIRDFILPDLELQRVFGRHLPTTPIHADWHGHLDEIRTSAIALFKLYRTEKDFTKRARNLVQVLDALAVPPASRQPACELFTADGITCHASPISETVQGPCLKCLLLDTPRCKGEEGARIGEYTAVRGETMKTKRSHTTASPHDALSFPNPEKRRSSEQSPAATSRRKSTAIIIRPSIWVAQPKPTRPQPKPTNVLSTSSPKGSETPSTSQGGASAPGTAAYQWILDPLRRHLDKDGTEDRKDHGAFVFMRLHKALAEGEDTHDIMDELRRHATSPTDELDENRRKRAQFIIDSLQGEIWKGEVKKEKVYPASFQEPSPYSTEEWQSPPPPADRKGKCRATEAEWQDAAPSQGGVGFGDDDDDDDDDWEDPRLFDLLEVDHGGAGPSGSAIGGSAYKKRRWG